MDIRLYKIVCGDLVMGLYDADKQVLKDIVNIQTVPTAGGIQLALLPYGFPFDDEIGGEIEARHFVYEYKKITEDLKNKYIEAKSSIKIASADALGGRGGGGIIM